VTAPSVRDAVIPLVAAAPAEWAAHIRESLAKRLPAPSVPTRIFLVDQFVLNPVSGKVDRKRLPDLSGLQADGGTLAGAAAITSAEGAQAGTPAPGLDMKS
jgi:hypothetical protein